VLEIAIAAAAPDKVMIAGVGHESVRQTVAMAETAGRLNYDAVLVRTPHFYRRQFHRSDAPPLEMLTYYRAVADASPLPVVLYSVPTMTLYELPVEAVAALAEHPNIIGLKESSGKPERIAATVNATRFVTRSVAVTPTFAAVTGRMLRSQPDPSGAKFVSLEALGNGGAALAVASPATIKTRQKQVGFSVLTGGAATLRASLDAGASGAVLAFAACAPQCCYEVWTAWKEGDSALAEEKQARIGQPSQRVAGEMGIPALKFACDLNGYFGGRPRLPLLPLTAGQQQELERLMQDIQY